TGRQRANANALPVLPIFVVHLPAIATREYASSWKPLRRCLPLTRRRERAISCSWHFSRWHRPISSQVPGCARIEFRSPSLTRRDAAHAQAQSEAAPALPSTSVALQGLPSLSAIRL